MRWACACAPGCGLEGHGVFKGARAKAGRTVSGGERGETVGFSCAGKLIAEGVRLRYGACFGDRSTDSGCCSGCDRSCDGCKMVRVRLARWRQWILPLF